MSKRQETLARTYAIALFRKGGSMSDEAVLVALAQALKTQPKMMDYFSSPTITLQDKEAVLQSALGPSASKMVLALLHLLLRHHQMLLLPLIATHLRDQWDLQEGVQSVDVETENALTDIQRKRLDTILAKQFGSQVRTTYGVDPDLLGGLVVRSKGRVLDESVRGRLSALREQLFSD